MGAAAALPDDLVETIFDTSQPTHDVVERGASSIFNLLERGQCYYIIVFEREKPRELCFMGYSYD